MKKRVCAAVLAAAMTLSLAGCGETVDVDTGSEGLSEYVYVPEYFDWGFEESENTWISLEGISGDYVLAQKYSYDAESGKDDRTILTYNIKDKSVSQVAYELEQGAYTNSIAMTMDGGVMLSTEQYVYDNGSAGEQIYKFMTLDASGQVVDELDTSSLFKKLESEYEYFYIQDFCLDDEGNIYITFEQDVLVLKPDGTLLFKLSLENWIQSVGRTRDGSVYVTYYGMGGTNLAVIDKKTRTLGDSYELAGNVYGFFDITDDGVAYYSNGNSVIKHTLSTGEQEVLLDWLDADILGDYIEGVAYVDDEHIFAYSRDWNTGEEDLLLLARTERSEVSDKQILRMVSMNTGSDIQGSIIRFNKSSDAYRIELTAYLDTSRFTQSDYENYDTLVNDAVTRMLNDITGSNPPDIICLGEGSLDLATLARQGAVEELTPYLEQAGYSEDDFVDGVVEAFKEDGKLYCIPKSFGLRVGLADSAIVGDKQGWTLAEALEVIKNLPEGMSFMEYATQESFVTDCLMYSYDSFIDEQNSTCNFDSDEFRALLEAAKTFPKEYVYDDDAPVTPELIAAGELLWTPEYIYDLESIQLCTAYFGDKTPAFIGYPGAKGNGCLIDADGLYYTICSKSEHKDAAAGFIIDNLMDDSSASMWYVNSFPVVKSALEKMLADAIAVEYVRDDNGELVLDQDGNPIEISSGGAGIGIGDWYYEYRKPNQEDVDLFLELLEGVSATANYNTSLYEMITEELSPYFAGQKSADEVIDIIENRVNLYLNENN